MAQDKPQPSRRTEESPRTRVLIVEDSAVMREFLVRILSSDPALEVVGTAVDGKEALECVQRLKPDVITMDINMPRMDGLEATRRLMEQNPTPIVIVTTNTAYHEIDATFQAIKAGALAVVARPHALDNTNHESEARRLIRTVKAMAEVKVVRRWPAAKKPAATSPPLEAVAWARRRPLTLVAIGASTGGPTALHTILSALPSDFKLPILIVQHIAPGFVHGFAEWLSRATGFETRVAEDGAELRPRVASVAPDHHHMTVTEKHRIALLDGQPCHRLIPSASILFQSVARICGPASIGILLSGMGRDGADGLLEMRRAGAVTLVQDERSSAVHSMPSEALKLGATEHALPPDKIAAMIIAMERAAREAKE